MLMFLPFSGKAAAGAPVPVLPAGAAVLPAGAGEPQPASSPNAMTSARASAVNFFMLILLFIYGSIEQTSNRHFITAPSQPELTRFA